MNENFNISQSQESPRTIRERIEEKIKNSKLGKYLGILLLTVALSPSFSQAQEKDESPTVKVLVKGGTMINPETGEEGPMIIDAQIKGARLKTDEEK